MDIFLSNVMGFCYGVQKAVDKTNNIIETNKVKNSPVKSIKTFGSIIHNAQFIAYLEKKGVQTIHSLDEINSGILITRTHGLADTIIASAKQKGLIVKDIICPYVKHIHAITKEAEKKGRTIFIFGEKNHAEVIGIAANLKHSIIISSIDDLPEDNYESGLLVSQTTQNKETFEQIASTLKQRVNDLNVVNTICDATKQRQDAAVTLAKTVDKMIVIGGFNSGNTKRLYGLCSKIVPSIHIETKKDLEPVFLENVEKIGITAGASTPEFVIQVIISELEQNYNGVIHTVSE